ncbi:MULTISPECIES: GH1 family beta-glucosidase [Brevibacterium]|jgi:beta-glucosidase|uniref:Beta-glucosidase n=4 Tax=Brevibacterium TaxID=1696 RepID=A0A0B9A8W4_BRELN|nr:MULTISPECIES: GH1 family beta-glucosidase [Brevibacterium]KHS51936.1 beta-galactosidase [Brevibacterium linens]HJE78730.1 beta-glucosidase [Brevibacterium epidermidis]
MVGKLPNDADALAGMHFSAATAAFQIEGARTAAGRGRSIWDDFVDAPGNVIDGSPAEPGPDSFHRFDEDIALLAGLGVDRYRFSISWTRVIPNVGTDASVNPAGLDYYDRLVDGLLAAGITPEPTLYHWDLPVALEASGGWLNRDTVHRFGDYTEVVADRLGDRVRHWYTINEPASTSLQGYALGELAPGQTLLFEALPTVHHQLLAHGIAAPILRENGAVQAAPTLNHSLILPASEAADDQAAAGLLDVIHNRLFTDPLLLGTYPDLSAFGVELPIEDGDMELISAPNEVYGFNYYNPTTVRASEGPLPFEMVPTPGAPVTGFGPMWPIRPDTMRDFLIDMARRYESALPPIIITENGASFPEPDTTDTEISDSDRIDYLRDHLGAVIEAKEAGVRIDGYTVWSLLDNFEWADGWSQRFGLVHVDMRTGTRTPKASFRWYRDLISAARS